MGRLGDHIIDYNNAASRNTLSNICKDVNGTTYQCARGYCCEGDKCCPYYYELWWFWFIWVLAILLSFCCAYHHKRKTRQIAFRTSPLYDTQDLYSGACNYPGPPLDNKSEMMGYTKLPIYDDVIRIPPSASPPPPYSSRRQPVNTVAYVQPDTNNGTSLQIVECNITSSMLSLASLSHYIPGILQRANLRLQSARNSSASLVQQQQTNAQQQQQQVADPNNNQPDVKSLSSSSSDVSCSSGGDVIINVECGGPSSSTSNESLRHSSSVRGSHHQHQHSYEYDDSCASDSEDDDGEGYMLGVDSNNNNVDADKMCDDDDEENDDDAVDSRDVTPQSREANVVDSSVTSKNQEQLPVNNNNIQNLIEDPQGYSE